MNTPMNAIRTDELRMRMAALKADAERTRATKSPHRGLATLFARNSDTASGAQHGDGVLVAECG